jgi:pyridoxal phosphate enzyme (YggS family)
MIAENVRKIRERIDFACRKAGREPGSVALIAVSKTFPAARVIEAVECGVTDFGENYIQELLEKRNAIGALPLQWHFVGHLQSNKVKYIGDWIHLIHSVDSLSLAKEVDKRAGDAGRKIQILVEVNTTGEVSKFGKKPEETLDFVRQLAGLSNIQIVGLMTIGPFLPDPEDSRPMFKTLSALNKRLADLDQRNVNPIHLSMGMSGDFEVAIEEGATMVRIGTAIFGRRQKLQEAV